MNLSKKELLSKIYENNLVDNSVDEFTLLSMIFHHSHTMRDTINGLRLTSYGNIIFSSLYKSYVFNGKCTLTSSSIIVMFEKLNGPWSFTNKLTLFDTKDYARLNLYSDFGDFIKSYKM